MYTIAKLQKEYNKICLNVLIMAQGNQHHGLKVFLHSKHILNAFLMHHIYVYIGNTDLLHLT